MRLRGGHYVSPDDLSMKLLGVYVAEVGRLHARLQLEDPSLRPLDPWDHEQHTVDYRHVDNAFAPASAWTVLLGNCCPGG